ncbi:Gamma-glutamyl-L-1-hydroxyisopropylamide hydrolase [Alphaproteobacteria bacterium SO-S41]|nr:Gamma-glutamyl-L-1-hydroxyisopropylamide hydrolase [Alphaproteobacteria bacterium SO-S41]
MTLRLLVIEGNVKANRERAVASGGTVSSDSYGELLRRLGPAGTIVDICYPADPGANLPDTGGLESYDGVAITGSALNVYDGGPAVYPQIDLVRTLFRTATPCFGSCWGLQIATVAAGGTVRKNPDGREIGIGRRIAVTEAGHGHGLFMGKPRLFDAITVHLDEVETLAPGTTVLATNDWSPVQAAEIETPGGGGFWGTQYHPEYDFREIAAIFRRYGDLLIRQGLFADAAEQATYTAELDALHADPAPKPLVWKYGLDETVLDPALRSRELKNWIEQAVLPAKSTRGRA